MSIDSLTLAALGLAGDVRPEQIALFGLLSFDAIPVDVGNPALATLDSATYWLTRNDETQLAAAFAEADTLAVTGAMHAASALAAALDSAHSTSAAATLPVGTCSAVCTQLASAERSASLIAAMALAAAAFAEADARQAHDDASALNATITETAVN